MSLVHTTLISQNEPGMAIAQKIYDQDYDKVVLRHWKPCALSFIVHVRHCVAGGIELDTSNLI